jgi:hypothetical protein
MKEIILNNLNNPGLLEKLYREDKSTFRREFNMLYSEISESAAAGFWYERLNYSREEISWGRKGEIMLVAMLVFFAGLIAKLPQLTGMDPDLFFQRNIGFVFLPALAFYLAWKNSLKQGAAAITLVIVAASAIYMNLIPVSETSDTLILAAIHMPLLMWSVAGFVFTGGDIRNISGRAAFLKYTGDLVVMSAMLMIAGLILSGVTFGLFELIGISLEDFYINYLIIWGLPAVPIVAGFLVHTNTQLVGKVSTVIAKVFTPLAFVMLSVYLIAVLYTGKDPYNDREFLMIFNLLLLGVMAIIFFSVAESSYNRIGKSGLILLLGLAIVTVIINGIALSAIWFRISEWGFTPNRIAVLGSNVIMLIHLLTVTYNIIHAIKKNRDMDPVANSIAAFLPVYAVWVMLVTFVLPAVFNFS